MNEGAGEVKRHVKTIASVAFLVVALGLLVAAVVKQWSDFTRAVGLIDAQTLLLALFAAVVAQFTSVMASRESLAATSHRIPVAQVARAFLTAALGKYVPGAVWPVAAQMELMKRNGVPRTHSAVAAVLTMTIGLGAAVVAGVLGVFLSGGSIAKYWWLVPIAAMCFAALWPGLLTWVLRLVARVGWRFRAFGEVSVGGRPLLGATAWSLLGAVSNGFQTWVIVRAISTSGTANFWLALGAAQLAFAVGFVIIIAPGGIGPREAVLVALLGPIAGTSGALAVAIISRLAQIAIDCLGALVALLLSRRHRHDDVAFQRGETFTEADGRRSP
ncbi:lysylphosphatidylglycerol synthase transmembrane domain-containing protein [Gryllotalpicola koreensis]|uniref:Lysylphosphatidylglycerol synthase transmembrane domain-containing protein n=2 Tax=Gryllotalpicola koreensis TaxID=993086 RepID=A0ABP8A1G3_9MICO